MNKNTFSLLLILTLSMPAYSSEWDIAATKVQTKIPSTIKELPNRIKMFLSKSKCNIPTGAVGTKTPSALASIKGWTKGSFAKIGQTDFAVICIKGNNSIVSIIWGGSSKCEDLADFKSKIKNNLYGGSSQKGKFFYFSRDLLVEKIKPHDVLIESNDKGAERYFCSNGKWTKKSLYH